MRINKKKDTPDIKMTHSDNLYKNHTHEFINRNNNYIKSGTLTINNTKYM